MSIFRFVFFYIVDDMDYHMKIIYINEKRLSYNEATHACAILNATLLTMRSWQKWFMVQQLFNSSSDWNKQACVFMKIYNVKQLIWLAASLFTSQPDSLNLWEYHSGFTWIWIYSYFTTAWKGLMKKKISWSCLFRQISNLFGRIRIYLEESGFV